MSLDTIATILNPRAVAIVGASDELQKWGGSMLALLRKFHYGGQIYPVNPKSQEVQGLPAFASVRAIAAPVDMALVAVPNERVLDAIRDCAGAGVKAVLMVTSQFAEAGEQGRALQEQVVAIARAAGTRIIGPNCMGYFSSHASLCLLNSQALMRNASLPAGSIALVSQSGALAGTMLARAYDLGAGFSFCVSLGNQADLEICDFLEYAIADAHTRVISLYVEGLKDPLRFLDLLRRARAAGKPVLLTKAGRTDSGQRAVQSHTASMAGAYRTFEACVRHAGAVIVDDPLELVVQAAAWASLPAPAKRGVAVFSGSGGGGAVASDLVDEAGLRAATLSGATVQALAALMPAASAHLPFDLGSVPAADRLRRPDWLKRVLATMMADDHVGAGLFVMTTQPDMVGAAETVIACQRDAGKPLLFVNAASSCGDAAVARLREAGLPHFASVKEATRFLVNRLADARAAGTDETPAAQPPFSRAEVDAACRQLRAGLVPEHQAKQLLCAAGIATTGGEVAASAGEAVELARRLGFPLAMKVVSPQISHKSDIGGVALDIADEAMVASRFADLRAAAGKVPGAVFEGCLLQRMARADAELLVGTHWDTQFGAMLTFGFGGTLVELQRDTALLPATASRPAIARALSALRQYPLLNGYRGRPPARVDGIVELIHRMGQLAAHLGERLAECEANPVMVHGDTILVADARAVWKEEQ
ncbi:hypothetical protein BKK81_25895 [Cupriavidus sp. USMAHM13]|uniref:acetate--CoA ligase family protein n=1 Tax=Cupriavidus sp. USMAHM13 TaxID=1389192 RepID=UPI0008A698B1|nr:acetate--CoA ligase [Cupriavidus sp. USMAHM13]AOZ02643.1 hypothetical protein BKK81_25895 [Cupriavidus sp. USMAHM13]